MMIRYIKRSEIAIEKYDLCIKNSKNSRIYAFSWYLDIVADNWDALILNDYEAVMPLPWRSKYFIKYIYPPCWTQQLGVFSAKKIDSELVTIFIKSIPKKFKKITINFNSDNQILSKDITEKVNYILPLNKPYNDLFRNYKSVRKRSKNQLNTDLITVSKSDNPQEIIQLFISQKQKDVELSLSDYNRLETLIKFLKNTKDGVDIIIAKNKKGVLLGGAFFLKDSKRITYLFSSISQEGKDEQVMTYIIDTVIAENTHSKMTLDFEGSMIPGIAFFFKSFGAQKKIYFNYQKRFLNFSTKR